MEITKNLISKLYSSLDFKRKIIGIDLIKTKKEFDQIDAILPKQSMNYCTMVKSASCGHFIKGNSSSFRCRSGPRVLGIDKNDFKNSNGENWAKLGLYENEILSKEIRMNLPYLKESFYGIVAAPLEILEKEPKVVIIIDRPYIMMRLLQGYSYYFGQPKNINMIANQAICLECTANVYNFDELNISLLCTGTRHKNRWDEEDMAIGIPWSKFDYVAKGVYETLNIMEDNKNKKEIEKKLKKNNINDLKIKYDFNYYNQT